MVCYSKNPKPSQETMVVCYSKNPKLSQETMVVCYSKNPKPSQETMVVCYSKDPKPSQELCVDQSATAEALTLLLHASEAATSGCSNHYYCYSKAAGFSWCP